MRNPEIWIGLVILGFLLFGAKRMPDAARGLGRSLRIFKSEIKGLDDDHPAQPNAQSVPQALTQAAPLQQPAYQQPAQPAYQPQPVYQQPQPVYQQPQPVYQQPQPVYQQPAPVPVAAPVPAAAPVEAQPGRPERHEAQ